MKSNQTLAILFWHRKSRMDKNGYAPIICRITIDGLEEEFWTSKKVHVDEWDIEAKRAVKGKDFKKALFGIWLCDKPADKNLKAGMLGK